MTNTNWQSYSGESTMGHLVQMAGLAVQNFVSAAVGIAVAVALVRGFARSRTEQLGNFWVDLTRIVLRILLPIAVLGAIVLIAGGVVQNLSGGTDVTTLTGGSPDHHRRPGGQPGGHQGAGHQRRRLLQRQLAPTRSRTRPPGRTGCEIFLILLIPFSLPRIFGRMVGQQPAGLRDRRGDGRSWPSAASR